MDRSRYCTTSLTTELSGQPLHDFYLYHSPPGVWSSNSGSRTLAVPSTDKIFGNFHETLVSNVSTMPSNSQISRNSTSIDICHRSIAYGEPTWMLDSETDVCMMCRVSFTLTNRKHHCRICGKIFCHPCASQRLPIHFLNNAVARVCLLCFKRFNTGRSAQTSRRSIDLFETSAKVRLPPVAIKSNEVGGYQLKYDVNAHLLIRLMSETKNPLPVSYVLNPNLVAMVKTIKFPRFPGKEFWLLVTRGLSKIGQEEMMMILEKESDEVTAPTDMMLCFNNLYKEASFGTYQHHLSCSELPGGYKNGGFLFVDVQKLCKTSLRPARSEHLHPRDFTELFDKYSFLPKKSFLLVFLITPGEIDMAKISPIRLLLRLASDQNYYPYPLASKRTRRSVYSKDVQTIFASLLQYGHPLPLISGAKIEVSRESKVSLKLSKNSYSTVMKCLQNEEIIVILSDFNEEVDKHLICIENEGNLLVNRTLTSSGQISEDFQDGSSKGAGFVMVRLSDVDSSCSFVLVEDGVFVDLDEKSFIRFRSFLKNMDSKLFIGDSFWDLNEDLERSCGDNDGSERLFVQTLEVQWIGEDDDGDGSGKKVFNFGATSEIDGMNLERVECIRTKISAEEKGVRFLEMPSFDSQFNAFFEPPTLRWTEVYIIETRLPITLEDDFNLNGFVQKVATTSSQTLLDHVLILSNNRINSAAVRVSIRNEESEKLQISIESGSSCKSLPPSCSKVIEESLTSFISEFKVFSSHAPLAIVFELTFDLLSLSITLGHCPLVEVD